ncbi:MAG: ATP-binding cassette domain-containing protein [Aggregatilineales bacterium]
MSKQPLLVVNNLEKQYTRGFFKKERTFSLKADFVIDAPAIIGIMGANGAGKTTMFEMITGTTSPTSGQVICGGQDIHNVKYHERDRLAIHYHQSYQVRNIQWTKPAFLMESTTSDYPLVHLFDEPQFNTQDGYIHFMLDFFRRLRAEGRIVFISVHPTEIYQLQIVENICEHFMFVADGKVTRYPDWETFTQQQIVRDYLGDILINYETT